MRVLQILPELNVGGVETGTVDFAQYLVAKRHHSVVISNGGRLVPVLERTGTKHHTLPVHKKSLWTIISLIKKVRRIIRSEKIDIVHARSRVPAWIAFFACRKTNAAFITTCHGYYKNRLFSQVMGWSKLVITPSKVIGKHMIRDFKVPAAHIRTIPRSVNLEKFPPHERKIKHKPEYTVAIIGRITPLKGHTYFLRAMARVARTMPYIKIWVVGSASAKKEGYKKELEMLVQRLGLKNNVVFLGSKEDIPAVLAQVDAVVLSTVTQEAFGRVILEAQAAGVPVVATKVGGVVDIIDDEQTGLLVLPKDTEAMAKAVLRVLEDKALASRLVKAARKKLLDQYTLEHMASQTLAVYEELLNTMNILVVKLSAVGDVILISPSLKALRAKFPRAKISALTGHAARKVLLNCPYIDDLLLYDYKHKDKGIFKLLKLTRKLRRSHFDKIIDFQNNRRSHLLTFLSFPRESYGYNNGKWGRLLSCPVKHPRHDLTAVPHQFQILAMLDITYDNSLLELWPAAHDKAHAQKLLDSEWLGNSRRIVGINIAASEKWKTKNWPLDYIARLCDILAAQNIRVLITGVDKDKDQAQHLLKLTKSKPALYVGKTDVLHLACLIERCHVFITPDSAPMHVAAAMRTPFIAFFGPTDPHRHLPPADKYVILDKKLECAPCYSPYCRILSHACLRGITPEEVATKIQELMAEQENSAHPVTDTVADTAIDMDTDMDADTDTDTDKKTDKNT